MAAKDVISYGEYQNLSEAEKAQYDTNWNSDGKSGVAYRKGYKPKETKLPTAEIKNADPDSKSVISREEAAKSGIKGAYEDKEGVHLNSKATEARNAAAKEDKAEGRDYRTAKAPSAYELDLRNKNLSEKHYDGTYVHDDKDLQSIIDKYSNSDPELAQAAKDELAKRKPASSGKVALGGLSTEEWVKMMKDKGMSDEEISEAYEKEGFSRDGRKFQTAMKKYATEETKEPEEKPEETEIKTEEDIEEKVENPPQRSEDIKRFSKDLNRFVIQAYINGDFGKKSDPNAIATMGYFILDKIGSALVNASQVARGMSPSATSQWSKVLDKQTDLLGKDITQKWFGNLSAEEQANLLKTGAFTGTTAKSIYENTDTSAVTNAKERDVLDIKKLSQEQKSIAQSNLNALIARKAELQALITKLKSDKGWEAYTEAMNAVVGTAKGLNSVGVADTSSTSSQKGFADTLSTDVSAGSIPSMYVRGGISNSSSWNNSSAEALSKHNTLSQDALALSKFSDAEAYAKSSQQARTEANKELISNLENQIKIIDACISSWGKDLGVR